jgi:phosphatidylserine/phosphatidylglycerophosphate/cardiolipin synthase-like enzyme
LDALALGFAESSASSVEVLVEGESFYPPMLADVESASSSVHINQFGFRPGVVGDAFADALVRKAEEGVPIRLVVDGQGSDPEAAARAHSRPGSPSSQTRAWIPRSHAASTILRRSSAMSTGFQPLPSSPRSRLRFGRGRCRRSHHPG